MNLFFDIEKHDGWYDECSPEERIILDTIKQFIYDRILPLQDEIDEEEKNGPKCIVIFITTTPKKIQPRGYSNELHEKIVNIFDPEDVANLWREVDDSLRRFLN